MRSPTLVALTLSLTVAVLGGVPVAAQDATPAAASSEATLAVLFVQSFASGSLEPTGEPGAATLTLQQPQSETIYFADRPNRAAGAVAIEELLHVVTAEIADPLNAALVIDRPEGDAVVILELLGGAVDASGTVTYDVLVLADPGAHPTDMTLTADALTELSGALDFGSSHLFIDNATLIHDPETKTIIHDPEGH